MRPLFDFVREAEGRGILLFIVDVFISLRIHCKGPFNNYVDKMRGGGGQKMSVFVHAGQKMA